MLMLKNCIFLRQQKVDQIFNTANPFLEGHKIAVTFDLIQYCMAKVTKRLHNLLNRKGLIVQNTTGWTVNDVPSTREKSAYGKCQTYITNIF